MLTEKPKRHPDDEGLATRSFYVQLFLYLMLPACLLGGLLMLPVLAASILPLSMYSECEVIDPSGHGIKIESESEFGQSSSQIELYWTYDAGEAWALVQSLRTDGWRESAACHRVTLMDAAFIYYDRRQIRIGSASGQQAVLLWNNAANSRCQDIRDVELTAWDRSREGSVMVTCLPDTRIRTEVLFRFE